MLLGQMIRDLTDENRATEALVALGDLPLLARLERHAQGEAAGAYAANAVALFADGASDEDWLGLMNRLERTDDPAAACLRTMIEWSLDRDAQETHEGCTCGG